MNPTLALTNEHRLAAEAAANPTAFAALVKSPQQFQALVQHAAAARSANTYSAVGVATMALGAICAVERSFMNMNSPYTF